MDFLQSLLDNSSIPAITAFILGTLTAVSPCPLATNITAIGFISKDIENHHRIFINGLLYTFGRIVTYTAVSYTHLDVYKRQFYTQVTPEDAEEIISEHIIGGRRIERLLYIDPKTCLLYTSSPV